MTTHPTSGDHAADTLLPAADLGRRRLLRTLGLLGVGVPVAGVLGTACTQEPQGASPRKTAEPVVARAAAEGGSSTPAAPAQAVDLPYLPVPQMPPALTRTTSQTVKVHLTVKDVKAKLADGAGYQFWTFNGTVPGPMIRVPPGRHRGADAGEPEGLRPRPQHRPARGHRAGRRRGAHARRHR